MRWDLQREQAEQPLPGGERQRHEARAAATLILKRGDRLRQAVARRDRGPRRHGAIGALLRLECRVDRLPEWRVLAHESRRFGTQCRAFRLIAIADAPRLIVRRFSMVGMRNARFMVTRTPPRRS